jgi:hypothetical protein
VIADAAAALSGATHGFPAGKAAARYACWRCVHDRQNPGFMTMSPAQVDLHRMVDRVDPDQVRALRAVAQQLLRPGVGHPGSGRTRPLTCCCAIQVSCSPLAT